MKVCSRCGEAKDRSEFYGNKSSPDELSVWCKVCNLAAKRERRTLLRGRSDAEIEAAAQAAGPRECRRCGSVKQSNDFAKDRGKPNGRSPYCHPCNAEKTTADRLRRPEQYRARRRADHGNNRERNRSQQLKQKFGITLEQYRTMHAAQGGVCAICGRPEPAVRRGRPCGLAVDHDHQTGDVRQLLCSWCNSGLGYFRDSPELLEIARLYLLRHGRGDAAAS